MGIWLFPPSPSSPFKSPLPSLSACTALWAVSDPKVLPLLGEKRGVHPHFPKQRLLISKFSQQSGRKKRTAKGLSVTNVTGPLLACFFGNSLNIDVFFLLQKDLFKGMWSLGEGFFEHNYCHACHTRFAVDFPVLLRKFTIDRLEDCRLTSKENQ